jgi:CrcB protein
MIKNILLVGIGGGIGSIARYLSQKWFADHYPAAFPWGTFGVNVAGCFLIGLFWGLTFRSFASNESWKLLLMTGLCGGKNKSWQFSFPIYSPAWSWGWQLPMQA